MALSIGIVGLPNVGKSTLFNALLKRQAALAANYPFATIEPNMGIVDVPDSRLLDLAEIIKHDFGAKVGDREIPEKIIPATVTFYDIAGLVKGAHKGEGLGNQFLSHIRDVNALVHVVRAFADENVIRADSTDPISDIEVINTELILADLQSLEGRISKAQQLAKKMNSKEAYKQLEIYEKLEVALNKGCFASTVALTENEVKLIKDLNLLTQKPVIYAFNIDEETMSMTNKEELISELTQNLSEEKKSLFNFDSNVVYLCAKLEEELVQLSDGERLEYMNELGLKVSGLDKIIKRGYNILGLQTYLTAGPKEVRAWTVKSGDTAPKAAGVIHSDFERGFISAEIVSFEALKSCGSFKVAKEKGLIRIEGKDYVMQEGDVVEFRFSV
ncbi:MAG: redox-regulated ATPase YchF [Patescibacteria group bacterium]